MIRRFVSAFVAGLLLSAGRVHADVQPQFINLGITNNPQIDATVIINAGQFTASSLFVAQGGSYYEVNDALILTNRPSGAMGFSPGFHFELITNVYRYPAANFVNLGTITASNAIVANSTAINTIGGITDISAGVLQVEATNIINTGLIDVGGNGLVRLTGKNVSSIRGGITAGGNTALPPFDGFDFQSFYFSPGGVSDQYWGAGVGNVLRGPALPMFIAVNGITQNFIPPFIISPTHEVVWPAFGQGALFLLDIPSAEFFAPGLPPVTNFNRAFSTFVWTNSINPTNGVIQVVFLANPLDTNIASQVLFCPPLIGNFVPGVSVPTVQFGFTDTDFRTGLQFTNTFYFDDNSMVIGTNTTLEANLATPTFKPVAYQMGYSSFSNPGFGFQFGVSSNSTLANSPFFQVGYSNRVVTNGYAAYSATLGRFATASTGFTNTFLPVGATFSAANTQLSDPTNFPGRIEISGDNLDLSLARFRAENFVNIRTTNLMGTAGLKIDSPVVNLDVAGVNSTINLTNILAASVKRFNGQFFAWSGTWFNTVNGIRLDYHVLVLDAARVSAIQPAILPQVSVRGTNVVVENVMNAGQSLVFDTPALTFNTNNQLILSSTTLPDFQLTNIPSLLYFTNFGLISVPSEAHFGSETFPNTTTPVKPLAFMFNSGRILAQSVSVWSTNFQNSGTILGQAGPVSVNSISSKLDSGQTLAGGDINITAADLKIRNYTATAGVAGSPNPAGAFNLNVTNSVGDGGAGASNVISMNQGFSMLVKPSVGDLLGTSLMSTSGPNQNAVHVWAAEDRGPFRGGFSNNVALGTLVLSTSPNASVMTFTGAGTNNAIYVDLLQLNGDLTANYSTELLIDTNMVVYFANANIPPETLDGALGGRLRWVREFAGPNSSADVQLADGRVIQVNAALLNSTTIDSDADGTANAFDPSPFDGVTINNLVTFSKGPPLTANVSWTAAAQTVYTVQVANAVTNPVPWKNLLIYTNSATATGVVTVQDTNAASSAIRFYRVLYTP